MVDDIPLNILGTEKLVARTSNAVARGFGLERKTSGTKTLELREDLSEETGYWVSPTAVSSKPPRWIVHLRRDLDGKLSAGMARDHEGELFQSAGTPGYINNGQGKSALAAARIVPAVRIHSWKYVFPSDWEWLIQFVFPRALPPGTSGDALSDFSLAAGTLSYKGRRPEREPYKLARICLFPTLGAKPPFELDDGSIITYDQATQALSEWLSAGAAPFGLYNMLEDEESVRLAADLSEAFTAGTTQSGQVKASLRPAPEDIYEELAARLSSGERDFLFVERHGFYLVAPPLATSGTASSSTSNDPGAAIE